MCVRRTLLIVLCAAFFSQAILVQSLENVPVDPSKVDSDINHQPENRNPQTRIESCPDGGFPLFNSRCISRSAYTGIFLTSIILAGLSFLMLIALAVLYFLRLRKDGSGGGDNESVKSDDSSEDNSSGRTSPSVASTVDRTVHEISRPNNRQQSAKESNNYSNSPNDYYVVPESSAPYTNRPPVRGAGAARPTTNANARAAASRPPPAAVIDDDSAF